MRLPSLQHLAAQSHDALLRFPFSIGAALSAAVFAQLFVDGGDDLVILRAMLTSILGISLFAAVELWYDRRKEPLKKRLAGMGLCIAVLLVFWIVSDRWTEALLGMRFAQLLIAFHLLVASLPFARTGKDRAFWQLNRYLFLRFLVATLYAGVLFAGLALAIAAVQNLFALNIDNDLYLRLFFFLGLVFHPWFFLGGLPRDLAGLEQHEDYPAPLKVFAQFILMPVVAVYVGILTAYLVRVVVTRTWPSGWIGWLVSGVSAAGVLALLLVHPVREREDSRWVNGYARWFFVALLPSAAMLIAAVAKRIGQYGITEPRYFLGVLALWLVVISAYYAITASRKIAIIPGTLCLIALGTFAGPQSAYAVSKASQAGRLQLLLVANGRLAGAALAPAGTSVSFEDRREISATLRYLIDLHGPSALRSTSPELESMAEQVLPRDSIPESNALRFLDDPAVRFIMDSLGTEFVGRGSTDDRTQWASFNAEPRTAPFPSTGYNVAANVNLTRTFSLPLGGDTLVFVFDSTTHNLLVTRGDPGMQIGTISLSALVDRAGAASPMRPAPETPAGVTAEPGSTRAPVIIDATIAAFRIRIVAFSATTEASNSGRRLTDAEATVLLGGG